jgi:hypothetical protein
VLAPFLPRERLVGIFGADLLDDDAQLDGFRELLGLTGFKPFECVGEIEESQVALVLAARERDWAGSALVPRLLDDIRAAGVERGDAEISVALAAGAEHELPPHAQAALEAVLAAAEPLRTRLAAR